MTSPTPKKPSPTPDQVLSKKDSSDSSISSSGGHDSDSNTNDVPSLDDGVAKLSLGSTSNDDLSSSPRSTSPQSARTARNPDGNRGKPRPMSMQVQRGDGTTKKRRHSRAKSRDKPRRKSTSGSDTLKRRSRTLKKKKFDMDPVFTTDEGVKGVVEAQRFLRGRLARMELEKRLEWQETRTYVAKEMLQTEINYVKGLEKIVLKIMPGFKAASMQEGAAISPAQFKGIFSHLDILLTVNQGFLAKLQPRIETFSPSTRIADLFIEMSNFLRIYTVYVEHYGLNVDKLVRSLGEKDEFKALLLQVNGTDDVLQLSSLLVTPIQRVPRYRLLLESIIKKTWNSHPDYFELKKAYDLIHETANLINERTREIENLVKLLEIQDKLVGLVGGLVDDERQERSSRTFVKDGTLTQIDMAKRKGRSKRYFLLCNDCLIRAKAGSGKNEGKYIFLEKVPLKNIRIKKVEEDDDIKFAFEIWHPKIQFTVMAENEKEKEEWTDQIKKWVKTTRERMKALKEAKLKVAKQKANHFEAYVEMRNNATIGGTRSPRVAGNKFAGRFAKFSNRSGGFGGGEGSISGSSPPTSGLSTAKTTDDIGLVPLGGSGGLRSYKTQTVYSKLSPQQKLEMLKSNQKKKDELKAKNDESEEILMKQKQQELALLESHIMGTGLQPRKNWKEYRNSVQYKKKIENSDTGQQQKNLAALMTANKFLSSH